jgi:energy-coupling factor transporter ATP-binding protein EcfA2
VQEAALYIARTADHEVETALRNGELCVLLGPPGSGKSSLRLRVGRALAADGGVGAYLPLGKLPSATPAAFCLGFMQGLGRALNLPPLAPFFQRYAEKYGETTPAERLEVFLREMVLSHNTGSVALFFDDLDALESICADTLCAALRGFYAAPPHLLEEPAEPNRAEPVRLGVCLSSSRDPEELGLILPRSARCLLLPAFSRPELDAFAPALAPLVHLPPETESDRDSALAALLDEVHTWTGGQPYLTQHLCLQLLARTGPDKEPSVEQLVETLFKSGEVKEDPVLSAVERRLTSTRSGAALLGLWRRLWKGETIVAEPGDAVQRALFLCGLCTCPETAVLEEGARLRPMGRIALQVFDDDWTRAQEARLLLGTAVAEGEAAKLRGAALKTAQTWAVRHLEAISPTETRALLVCLEAARQEAEARHQSSASALQRETRERAELRSQWNREREELTATSSQLQWRMRALVALAVLLVLLCLGLAYFGFIRRNRSSPLCQMSPAPSVMNRSLGSRRSPTDFATSLRRGTYSAATCPPARIFSTSTREETPGMGSSPAA